MTSTGLLMTQQMDHQELLPIATDFRTYSTSAKCKTIHQSWHQVGVQQCMHQRRRWTQSGVHYKPRAVWTHHYVFWADKLPSDLPNDDECNLCWGNSRRVANSLYGQHPHHHQRWPSISWKVHPQNAREAEKTWPLSQTGKMYLWTAKNWVPRSNPWEWDSTNGPSKDQRCSRLAAPAKCHRCAFLPRIHRVLLLFYTKLLTHCPTPDTTNMEKHPIHLGSSMHACLWTSQVTYVHKTHTPTIQLHKSLLPHYRCLSLWCGCHALTGGRTQP